jgi:hypothetical protein
MASAALATGDIPAGIYSAGMTAGLTPAIPSNGLGGGAPMFGAPIAGNNMIGMSMSPQHMFQFQQQHQQQQQQQQQQLPFQFQHSMQQQQAVQAQPFTVQQPSGYNGGLANSMSYNTYSATKKANAFNSSPTIDNQHVGSGNSPNDNNNNIDPDDREAFMRIAENLITPRESMYSQRSSAISQRSSGANVADCLGIFNTNSGNNLSDSISFGNIDLLMTSNPSLLGNLDADNRFRIDSQEMVSFGIDGHTLSTADPRGAGALGPSLASNNNRNTAVYGLLNTHILWQQINKR